MNLVLPSRPPRPGLDIYSALARSDNLECDWFILLTALTLLKTVPP
jgi:hypothetical protein